MISKKIKFTKIFSIPGHIRIRVDELKSNRNYAVFIEKNMNRLYFVNLIKANHLTGNVLIVYDVNLIDEANLLEFLQNEQIGGHFKTIKYTGRKNSKESVPETEAEKNRSRGLFREEKSLMKRLIVLSFIAAAIHFIRSSPIDAIGSLLFGFPAILYLLVYLSLKYTITVWMKNNIDLKDFKTARKIQKIKSILLPPDIVFSDKSFENMSYIEIENEIACGRLEDPITREARRLVIDLHKLGMNDISILNDGENPGLYYYGCKSLGLNFTDNSLIPKSGEESYEILIQKKRQSNNIRGIREDVKDNRIIAYISETGGYPSVPVQCLELGQIPWLIKLCRRSNEYLTRSLLVYVGINIFDIMLTFTRHLHFFALFFIYTINTLGNVLYLRHNILNYSKENVRGEQRKFVCA